MAARAAKATATRIIGRSVEAGRGWGRRDSAIACRPGGSGCFRSRAWVILDRDGDAAVAVPRCRDGIEHPGPALPGRIRASVAIILQPGPQAVEGHAVVHPAIFSDLAAEVVAVETTGVVGRFALPDATDVEVRRARLGCEWGCCRLTTAGSTAYLYIFYMPRLSLRFPVLPILISPPLSILVGPRCPFCVRRHACLRRPGACGRWSAVATSAALPRYGSGRRRSLCTCTARPGTTAGDPRQSQARPLA